MRIGAALAIVALTAGCADSAPDEGESRSLRVGVAAPTLPGAREIALQYHRNALSREALLVLGNDGRPGPRVLESWTASPDGLSWTLRIRGGVKYHDGSPVTAGDLAPQLLRYLQPRALGAVEDVQPVGPPSGDTLVISLNEPYAFLAEDLSVMNPQKVDSQSKAVFGTGAYRIIEESVEYLKLRAVESHYRSEPEIDEVEVRLFPDQRNAWSALMQDRIDMLYDVSPDSLQFVRGESLVRVATFPRPYVRLLAFNQQHPHLKDARVRRAINVALDRQNIVDQAMSGEGEPAAGHVWPPHWAFDPTYSSVTRDLEQARRLLDEAGLPLRTEPGRMPARLRIKCLVYEQHQKVALVVQRQLAAIDVDLQLEMPPTQALLESFRTGQFEAFIFEMNSGRGFKWPYQFWHSSSGFLKHGYSGADAALDRVRRAPNETAFRAAVSELQRVFLDDPPAAFLAWGKTSRAVTTRFEVPTDEEDIFHSVARWKPVRR